MSRARAGHRPPAAAGGQPARRRARPRPRRAPPPGPARPVPAAPRRAGRQRPRRRPCGRPGRPRRPAPEAGHHVDLAVVEQQHRRDALPGGEQRRVQAHRDHRARRPRQVEHAVGVDVARDHLDPVPVPGRERGHRGSDRIVVVREPGIPGRSTPRRRRSPTSPSAWPRSSPTPSSSTSCATRSTASGRSTSTTWPTRASAADRRRPPRQPRLPGLQPPRLPVGPVPRALPAGVDPGVVDQAAAHRPRGVAQGRLPVRRHRRRRHDPQPPPGVQPGRGQATDARYHRAAPVVAQPRRHLPAVPRVVARWSWRASKVGRIRASVDPELERWIWDASRPRPGRAPHARGPARRLWAGAFREAAEALRVAATGVGHLVGDPLVAARLHGLPRGRTRRSGPRHWRVTPSRSLSTRVIIRR